MGSDVSLGHTKGYLAEPAGEGKGPALVLVQEYWGLNAHIKSLVDRLAGEGFVVMAPDLYHGKITKDSKEAAEWMTALDGAHALGDIGAAAAHLASHPRSNGKVGIIGFCLGGAYAFAAAARLPGICAATPFYGVPPGEVKTKTPIQAHFAKHDAWASVAKAEKIQADVAAAGGHMEFFSYDAGHAFMNDSRPEAYNEAAAKVAWPRAVAFLKKHCA